MNALFNLFMAIIQLVINCKHEIIIYINLQVFNKKNNEFPLKWL